MHTFHTDVQLSHVPSILIRTGLRDLRLCEQMPDVYEINMSAWHEPSCDNKDRCIVCKAGAVMAQTLKAPAGVCLDPDNFSAHNRTALQALNHFRYAGDKYTMRYACGLINAALIKWNKEIPDYHEDREEFHRIMHKLADAFEKSGQ